jgi:hypothetical protein
MKNIITYCFIFFCTLSYIDGAYEKFHRQDITIDLELDFEDMQKDNEGKSESTEDEKINSEIFVDNFSQIMLFKFNTKEAETVWSQSDNIKSKSSPSPNLLPPELI